MQKNRRRPKGLLCVQCVLITAMMAGGLMAQAPADAGAANQALLNAIPGDATAFLAIRSLREFDRDIQAISTQIGFPLGAEGMFPAPLEMVKMQLGMTEGLQENGGAALVLLNARQVENVEALPDRMVLYLPSADPKALLTAMGAQESADGMYTLNLGGAPSVATTRESFALIAKAPDAPGETASAALTEAASARGEGVIAAMTDDRVAKYARQDVVLWINMRNISPALRQEITEGLRDFFAELSGGFGTTQPAQGEEAVQQVDKILTQSEELSLAILVDQQVGLDISGYSRVRPGTELARMVAATQAPKDSLLIGLPDEAFIFAGGAVMGTTEESVAQMRQAAENMVEQLAALNDDPESPLTPQNLRPLVDVWVNLVKATERAGLSVSRIGEPQGEGGVIGLTLVANVDDAQAWRAEARQGFRKAKELAAEAARAEEVEQEKIDEVLKAVVWQEDAARVAGASVDVLRVDLEQISDVNAEDIAQVKAVIGPEGILFRVAAVGNNQVAMTFGGGEERLAAVIGLLQGGQAPLANHAKIRKVADRLPQENRVAEVYISLDHLLGAVDAIATRVQSPLPVQLTMPDAAPIAFTTINVDEVSQQFNFLIPSELIASASRMVSQQLMPMIMMGGLGGGGQMQFEEHEQFDEPEENR